MIIEPKLMEGLRSYQTHAEERAARCESFSKMEAVVHRTVCVAIDIYVRGRTDLTYIPDRDVTEECIVALRKFAEEGIRAEVDPLEAHLTAADQLERERDFADRSNSDLGKSNARFVKLCEGLEKLGISETTSLLVEVGWKQ